MSHPAIPAELLAPPTENPCPSWCELRPGHGYESISNDGERQFRYHTGHEMRLTLASGSSAGVEITCEESADGAEQDVQVNPPAIEVWGTESARLTEQEALSLSDVLARAGLLLHKIEVGQ